MQCKDLIFEKENIFQCEIEIEDSNLSSWTRRRGLRGSTLNIATKKNTKKKKERKGRERKRLAKKKKLEQIDWKAPTREETVS